MKVSVTDVYNTMVSHDIHTLFVRIEYKEQSIEEERKECVWMKIKYVHVNNDCFLVISTI
jgi:hypothetical protein